MIRMRRVGVASALLASLLLVGSIGTVSAAGSPRVQFTFAPCEKLVDTFDRDGNPIQVPGIELLFWWSGAYVDNVQATWTRTDGQPVLFGVVDSDITAGTSGTADAGALIIQDDTGFNGLNGGIAVHRHLITFQSVTEPSGGWATFTPACT